MKRIGYPETSVTTNKRCVTSQNRWDLVYTVSEAWNYAEKISASEQRQNIIYHFWTHRTSVSGPCAAVLFNDAVMNIKSIVGRLVRDELTGSDIEGSIGGLIVEIVEIAFGWTCWRWGLPCLNVKEVFDFFVHCWDENWMSDLGIETLAPNKRLTSWQKWLEPRRNCGHRP